jgi:hypothetical protein
VRLPAVRRRRVRPGGPHEPSSLTPREADSGVRRRGEGCGRGRRASQPRLSGSMEASTVEALPGGYDQRRRRRRGGAPEGRRWAGLGSWGRRGAQRRCCGRACARSTPPGWPSSAAPWPSCQPVAAGGLPPAHALGRPSPRVQRCGGCVRSVHACSPCDTPSASRAWLAWESLPASQQGAARAARGRIDVDAAISADLEPHGFQCELIFVIDIALHVPRAYVFRRPGSVPRPARGHACLSQMCFKTRTSRR